MARKRSKKEPTPDAENQAVSSAHKVLSSTEILGLILNEFKKMSMREHGTYYKYRNRWRRDVAKLVLVNTNFFHAAIAQLWEEMESFEPFMKLLPSLESTNMEELHDVRGAGLWDRFLLYSSKTSSLALDRKAQVPSGFWLSFLTSHPSFPKATFPRLRTLSVCQGDVATFTVLSATAPQLTTVQISRSHSSSDDPNSSDEGPNFVKVVAATLSLKSRSLSTLRIGAASSPGTMEHLSKITGLENLVISGTEKPLQPQLEELMNVKKMKGLKTLALEYGDARKDGHEMSLDDFYAKFTPEISAALSSKRTELPSLKDLFVCGDALVHYTLARDGLLPSRLHRLDLLVRGPREGRVLLIPAVLQLYLTRNCKTLQRLRLQWDCRTHAGYYSRHSIRDDLYTVRRNAPFRDAAASADFFPALAQCTALTELKLMRVPFLDTEVITKLAELAPGLPNLTSLVLRPAPLEGHRAQDCIACPPHTVLERIAAACPCLAWLDMPVTWEGAPAPPAPAPDSLPRTTCPALEGLWVAGGAHPASLQTKIAIAQYLHTLFPRATSVAEPTETARRGPRVVWDMDALSAFRLDLDFWSVIDGAHTTLYDDNFEYSGRVKGKEVEFWQEVQVLLHSYAQVRKQAFQEFSTGVSPDLVRT